MAKSNVVTNDKIYELVNNSRLEFKQDLSTAMSTFAQSQGRLERKFDDLEAGRLTRLEGKMTQFEMTQIRKDDDLRQTQAVLSTKFVVIGGVAIAIFNALLYGLFTKVLK